MRKGYIDNIRAISAFAVVVIHVVSSCVFNSNLASDNISVLTCNIVHSLMNFSVPMFLIISGTVFFNNDKQYTYKVMFKYIKKIILCLIIFGAFYSLLEQIFTHKDISFKMIFTAFTDIITGNTWDHMWYLYTIIGIYILIPIIKPFMKSSSNKDKLIFLTIFILFNSLIPILNKYAQIKIIFTLPISGMFLFYPIAGTYIDSIKLSTKIVINSIVISSIVLILIIFSGINNNLISTDYQSLSICTLSLCLFIIFKSAFKNKQVNKYILFFSKNSLGIYLIHPLFINLLIKALKINILFYYPLISIPITCIIIYILSGFTTHILSKFLDMLYCFSKIFKNKFF